MVTGTWVFSSTFVQVSIFISNASRNERVYKPESGGREEGKQPATGPGYSITFSFQFSTRQDTAHGHVP